MTRASCVQWDTHDTKELGLEFTLYNVTSKLFTQFDCDSASHPVYNYIYLVLGPCQVP